MTETSVPEPQALLDRLAAAMGAMSPQLKKAAAHVLDHPGDVGLASVRELAEAAGVKPNTLVRMARAVGYRGYEDFRQPFRAALRAGVNPFPDRAEWLQELAAGGRIAALYADIAGAALANVEQMFGKSTAEDFKAVADAIVASRRTYVLGVGANHALALNFAYLVGMALDDVVAVPQNGNVPTDALVRAGRDDVVIAMTFEPYRSEVVSATEFARNQGAAIVAITDSHGSPIAIDADHVILAPSATPQFFPSTVAAAAALETLASFIVADAPKEVVSAIERFHRRRYDLGVYWGGPDG